MSDELDAGRRVIEDLVSKFKSLSDTPADPLATTDPDAAIAGAVPDPA